MLIKLDDYQLDAVYRLRDGCILCGDVGTGKSRTGLAYFYKEYGGSLTSSGHRLMQDPPGLYIITTAKKRDTDEWNEELSPFNMNTNPEANFYHNKVVVDSWNNVGKYVSVKDAFFIFDEQRVVGYGAWTKAFLKICKSNRWILLSATPGDKWEDYIPVFIANGFYKNITEFRQRHIVYRPMQHFLQVARYLEVNRLTRLRDSILIMMESRIQTVPHHIDITVDYNVELYKQVMRTRQNPFNEGKPFWSASEFCYALRRIVNTDPSRSEAFLDLLFTTPKVIVFYCFDYERDILLGLPYIDGTVIAEWSGHMHQPVPESDRWVYLVQYTAGAEGWNCIKTNTIVFYSQSYSYKATVQAAGRINRRNTPYIDLYYYHFKSKASIDRGISRALEAKKQFNITAFTKNYSFRMKGAGKQYISAEKEKGT